MKLSKLAILVTFLCFIALFGSATCRKETDKVGADEDRLFFRSKDNFAKRDFVQDENWKNSREFAKLFVSQQLYRFSTENRRAREKFESTASISCDLCKFIIRTLREKVEEGSTEEKIVEWATEICIVFQIEDTRVCKSVVLQYKDAALGVVDQLAFSPDEACAILSDGRCGTPYNPLFFWNLTLPGTPKPPVQPPVPPKPGSPTLKVLHLTDMHLDTEYRAGLDPDCPDPLCCRLGDGEPAKGSPGAGYWGNNGECDLPYRTMENLFQHVASIKDQFDMVYFTGDIPAHNIWNQTREDQLYLQHLLIQMFLKYLPDKPVYNSAGNHESSPCNLYPPPTVKGQDMLWLYGAFVESWTNWIPRDTASTILAGGFYTVSPFPGFRIVSINTNYCHSGNWWLLINTTDPVGQLQWLMGVLQAAEDAGEKVHILGHHPPGSCMQPWGWNYYKIVDRYESTITGQFFGHTHSDSFETFYDRQTLKRPTNIAYIAGSVTTYSTYNPGFRIYTFDGNYTKSSWAVLDIENFFVNLTKTNNVTEPVWEFEYSPKTAYSMKSLYPADWNDLIYRMKSDDNLFQLFHKYYSKSLDTTPCTGGCKRNMLCGLKSARSSDPNLCKDL